MPKKEKETDVNPDIKADDYDKEKDLTILEQKPSTSGDSESGNEILKEQGETD